MNEGIITIIIVALIAIAIFWMNVKKRKEIFKTSGGIEKIWMGEYVTGFSNAVAGCNSVDCIVTEKDFVFIKRNGSEIGKIPRNSINQIVYDRQSEISKRVTVPRILAVGILAFALKKTEKTETFFVIIDWNNEDKKRENTIFKLSIDMANNAISRLKEYVLTAENGSEIAPKTY